MASEHPIPVYSNLVDLFSSLGTTLGHAARWNDLAEQFERRFGRKPAYIARAPGRVNLIGEHIDYALFGVLPAAVERDILIACAPRPMSSSQTASDSSHLPGAVVAENLHAKYSQQVFAPTKKLSEPVPGEGDSRVATWHFDINTNDLRWDSYLKAGYYGVLDRYFSPSEASTTGNTNHPVPVDLLVTGTVPPGAGLSSSSAMIVASTLAFLAANGKFDDTTGPAAEQLTKGDLVNMVLDNEKLVGVNNGGMDQAASIMSNAASALYITFYPSLKASPIPLPPRSVFVCANSCVVSDKATTAKRRYNLRVVETLVGARVLAKTLGVQVAEKERITLREVLGRLVGERDGQELNVDELKKALERMVKEVEVLKPKGRVDNEELGVTMEEMVRLSGLPDDIFHQVYLSWVEVEATHFQLYKRAKHVYTEALRVLEFRQICLNSPSSQVSPGDSTGLESLGRLMNQSQTSCAQLFECSCPELDELTRLAREAGAYGSRLTGAGWGGYTVSLVAEDNVEQFITKMKDKYGPYRGLQGEALSEVIFATRPSSGACASVQV